MVVGMLSFPTLCFFEHGVPRYYPDVYGLGLALDVAYEFRATDITFDWGFSHDDKLGEMEQIKYNSQLMMVSLNKGLPLRINTQSIVLQTLLFIHLH